MSLNLMLEQIELVIVLVFQWIPIRISWQNFLMMAHVVIPLQLRFRMIDSELNIMVSITINTSDHINASVKCGDQATENGIHSEN